mmetsp:Transcript_60845/g.145009  ORF Transcript_60845/g.145009 Transcript_60845/m.145009 type:complete len:1186 (-) Transcript_60845:155-3712(-)
MDLTHHPFNRMISDAAAIQLSSDVAHSLSRIEATLHELKSGQSRLTSVVSELSEGVSRYRAFESGVNSQGTATLEIPVPPRRPSRPHLASGSAMALTVSQQPSRQESMGSAECASEGSRTPNEGGLQGSGSGLAFDGSPPKFASPSLAGSVTSKGSMQKLQQNGQLVGLLGAEVTVTSSEVTYTSSGDSSHIMRNMSTRVSRTGSGGYVAVTLPYNWPASLQLYEELVRKEDAPQAELISRMSACTTGLQESPAVRLMHPATTPMNRSLKPSEDGRVERRPWYIIHPDSYLHICLDFMATLLVLYELLVTPFCVAWDIPSSGWLLVLFRCSAGYWFLDLLMGFITGYYTQGQPELSPAAIQRHYLRGWFCVDFALVLCDVANIIATLIGAEAGHALRLLRLIRLCRVVSLAKVWSFIMRVEDVLPSQHAETVGIGLKLGRIALAVLGANHLLACLWMLIGRTAIASNGARWIDEVAWNKEGEIMTYEETDVGYQYLATFHWALAQLTLGTAGVGAYNKCEQIFTVACLMFGLLMGTSLISMFSAEMVEAQFSTRQKDMITKQLRKFLQRENIDHFMSRKVRAMVAHRLKTTAPLAENEVQSLRLLPLQMQMELHFEIVGPSLLTHPLFAMWHSFSTTSVLRVCMDSVQLAYVRENDELFSAGDTAERVWYLKKGRGTYHQDPESAPVVYTVTTKVPAGRWLAEPTLWVPWVHVGTFKLTENSEVLRIQAKEFAIGLLQYTVLQDMLHQYCRIYHWRLVMASPPRRKYPTDLGVPGTAFEDILFAMSPSIQEAILHRALHTLRTAAQSRVSFRTSGVQELEREYQQGGVVFLVGKDHGKCVSFRTSLRIVDFHSQMVLLHAGRLTSDKKLIVLGELPTTRQLRGETPEGAMSRILEARLQVLRPEFEQAARHKSVSRGSSPHEAYGALSWGSRSTSSHMSCQNVSTLTTFEIEMINPGVLEDFVVEPRVEVDKFYSFADFTDAFKKSLSNAHTSTLGGIPGYASKNSFKHKISRQFSSSIGSLSNAIFAIKNRECNDEDAYSVCYDLYMWVEEEDIPELQTGHGRTSLQSVLARLSFSDVVEAATSGCPSPAMPVRFDRARQVAFTPINEENGIAQTEMEQEGEYVLAAELGPDHGLNSSVSSMASDEDSTLVLSPTALGPTPPHCTARKPDVSDSTASYKFEEEL